MASMFEFIAPLPNINDNGKSEKTNIIIFSLIYVLFKFLKLFLFVSTNVTNLGLNLFLTDYI